MSNNLNLNLTKELKTFIEEQSGDGTLYATPSEFMRSLLREKKQQIDAANLRSGILEGFSDAINNKLINYSGNLKADIKKYKNNAN